jgi:hypothetical protein
MGILIMSHNITTMQLNVEAKLINLCAPIRASLEAKGLSHLAILNACNSHLGKLKAKQTGDDKLGTMKVSAKRDTSKVTLKPGSVEFTGTYNVVSVFIAWNHAVEKAHGIASMDTVSIPAVFSDWLKFAEAKPTAINEPVSA